MASSRLPRDAIPFSFRGTRRLRLPPPGPLHRCGWKRVSFISECHLYHVDGKECHLYQSVIYISECHLYHVDGKECHLYHV